MVNLIVNIVYGYVFQSFYTGYVYNKIKNTKGISSMIIFFISNMIAFGLQSFTYNNYYATLLITASMFYILYALFHKEWKQITNFFLILNIMLVTSIVTAIPIIFVGYNFIALLINFVELIIIMFALSKIDISKIHKIILLNWNRSKNNKIKSVTIRNITLILVCIMITLINIFVNNIFINLYQSVL